MMVTVFCSAGAACLGADFAPGSAAPEARRGGFLGQPARRLAQRDARDRLAAERIVGEDGEAGKGDQEQAEQHGQRLHTGERQPETGAFGAPFPVRAACSDRRPSLPWTSPNQPRRRYHDGARLRQIRRRDSRRKPAVRHAAGIVGTSQQKGRPEGRPFRKNSLRGPDQFAALVAGLSIAALSPVGAAALTLMPCSRSAAIFSALSSLASGGT